MPKPKKTAEELFDEERMKLGLAKRTGPKFRVSIKDVDKQPRKVIEEMSYLHQDDLDLVVHENYEMSNEPHQTGNFGQDSIQSSKN